MASGGLRREMEAVGRQWMVVLVCCVPAVCGQLDWFVPSSEVHKIESPSTNGGE